MSSLNMIKYFFVSLLSIGCAQGSEISLEAEQAPVTAKHIAATGPIPSPTKITQCDVVKSSKVNDCTLYFLTCDDGADDLFLACPIVNLGPPIQYQDPI